MKNQNDFSFYHTLYIHGWGTVEPQQRKRIYCVAFVETESGCNYCTGDRNNKISSKTATNCYCYSLPSGEESARMGKLRTYCCCIFLSGHTVHTVAACIADAKVFPIYLLFFMKTESRQKQPLLCANNDQNIESKQEKHMILLSWIVSSLRNYRNQTVRSSRDDSTFKHVTLLIEHFSLKVRCHINLPGDTGIARPYLRN